MDTKQDTKIDLGGLLSSTVSKTKIDTWQSSDNKDRSCYKKKDFYMKQFFFIVARNNVISYQIIVLNCNAEYKQHNLVFCLNTAISQNTSQLYQIAKLCLLIVLIR